MNPVVEILLSTFNGERYLSVQMDSIIRQDCPYWKMLIRDDGSSDGTVSILNKYSQQYPDKISLMTDNDGTLGYSVSYSKLLSASTASYVMFCDQDDYWEPNKISTMLSAMLEEEINLPDTPHIVFSDLQMADSELRITGKSFLKKLNYSPRKGMQIFFLKNYVPGCNLLFNRILIQQAFRTDNIINIHDHWLLMVCASTGKITFMDKPMMKYRIHDNNAIGLIMPEISLMNRIALLVKNCFKFGLSNRKYRSMVYSRNIQQIQNICSRLKDRATKEAIRFAEIDASNFLSRKINNTISPFIRENNFTEQLTYIICF